MQRTVLVLAATLLSLTSACGGYGHEHDHPTPHESDGDKLSSHSEDHGDQGEHEYGENALGTFALGDLEVELAQGHGALAAGEEAHLVVKLIPSDRGTSIVRAWIGSEDRTLSYVGKGEYEADHDDYNVHATAPDPLSTDAQWWIEVEKADGSKVVGSAPTIR